MINTNATEKANKNYFLGVYVLIGIDAPQSNCFSFTVLLNKEVLKNSTRAIETALNVGSGNMHDKHCKHALIKLKKYFCGGCSTQF